MRRYYLKEREMIKETEAIICNRCGKVTDMYRIAERMTGADKVIRP